MAHSGPASPLTHGQIKSWPAAKGTSAQSNTAGPVCGSSCWPNFNQAWQNKMCNGSQVCECSKARAPKDSSVSPGGSTANHAVANPIAHFCDTAVAEQSWQNMMIIA